MTSDGYPLEPAITIPSDTTKITIASDGRVTVLQAGSTTPVEIGTIETARFINPAGLQAIGKNLFLSTDASGEAATERLEQRGVAILIRDF